MRDLNSIKEATATENTKNGTYDVKITLKDGSVYYMSEDIDHHETLSEFEEKILKLING